jgi:hypothetical protein
VKLLLQRERTGLLTTFGTLSAAGARYETLEDELRAPGVKVWSRTCIPAGTYRVVVNYSNRFKRMLPLLLNVPGFEGVRIHSGNTHEDTEGCILVGRRRGALGRLLAVLDSRAAFDSLFRQIDSARKRGEEVEIEIRNPA